MIKEKNSLRLVLIISSIILLLVLQFFWLQKVYRDERTGFERETHMLFKNMLFQMHDSLIDKSIVPIWRDSISRLKPHEIDCVKISRGFVKGHNLSSVHSDTLPTVQIFVSSNRDSVGRYIRPMISKLRKAGSSSQQIITLQLRNDSLRLADVEKKFEVTLKEAGIQHSFQLKPITRPQQPFRFEPFRDSTQRDVVFTPSGGFKLALNDTTWLILKKITPQILFSVVLTLLTIGSFVILYRSLRMQQKLMELKNDFISNITHELKTPVTTVGVALEAIKNFKGQNNPELTTEYLDIAQNELNRLNILTDKILKTAIFEDRGVEFNAEPVDLHQLVSQVLGSMKLVFDKQKASVDFKTEGSDFNLLGGPTHLTSVVYNLLDNALKYSPAEPRISILLQEHKDSITLRIKDNGIGIAPEYKKKVFEKFFRVPTGDVHNIKGYGLGLSYVDSVIRSHKGGIEVESEPGKGSEFIIRLPKS